MSDNTKINPKHYIGKITKNAIAFFGGCLALSTALGYGVSTAIYDAIDKKPDTIGTTQQDATYKSLTKSITELDKQQTSLEIAKKQYEIDILKGNLPEKNLTKEKNRIDSLSKEFSLNGYEVLAGLYMNGTLGAEADISETKVLELSKVFADKIAPPLEFGLDITPSKIAYLDEARIKTNRDKNKTMSYVAQVKALDKSMSNHIENNKIKSVIPAGVGGGILFLFLILNVGNKLNDWSHEDKHITKHNKKSKFVY